MHFKSFLVILIFSLLISVPTKARVGDKLSEIQNQTLIKYFNLPEDAQYEDTPGEIVLHPNGSYSEKMVSLKLHVGADDAIDQMVLILDRDYINQEWVSARFTAKEFLHAAVALEDETKIDNLSNEIEYPQDSGIVYRIILPPLPSITSAGYLTFQGKQSNYEIRYSKTLLKMENISIDGKPALRMTVTSASASSQFASSQKTQ